MHRKTLCPLFSRHIEISTTDYVTVGKKKKQKQKTKHMEKRQWQQTQSTYDTRWQNQTTVIKSKYLTFRLTNTNSTCFYLKPNTTFQQFIFILKSNHIIK